MSVNSVLRFEWSRCCFEPRLIMHGQVRVSADSLRFAVPEKVIPIRNKVLDFVETEVLYFMFVQCILYYND